MSEPTQESITGLKIMVLGIQIAFFGRYVFEDIMIMILGGGITLIGLFVR